MTNEQHLILPSEKLVQRWMSQWVGGDTTLAFYIATQAAQLSADQELEACCEWMREHGFHPEYWRDLRDARRPKPPSLKEQALETLNFLESEASYDKLMIETIRRALKEL